MKKTGMVRIQLRESGWAGRQGRGSHEIGQAPPERQRRVVLSGRDGEYAPRYQEAHVRSFHAGMMVYKPVEKV